MQQYAMLIQQRWQARGASDAVGRVYQELLRCSEKNLS